jgi:hypothetical protein
MNDQALKAFNRPYTFWPQALAAHHNPFHTIVELHKDMQQARGLRSRFFRSGSYYFDISMS